MVVVTKDTAYNRESGAARGQKSNRCAALSLQIYRELFSEQWKCLAEFESGWSLNGCLFFFFIANPKLSFLDY